MMMMTSETITARPGAMPVPANEPALVCREEQITQPFHYWRGASGERYLHTVFSLVNCPLVPKVNYILVQRAADGTRRPLYIGRTVSNADSLNLAHLRHKAASLAANEIHIHFLSETERARAGVEADLAVRQLGRTVMTRECSAANDSTEAVCA